MNLIVYVDGTERILHYIEDAVINGTNIVGTNKSIAGKDLKTCGIRWTEDVLTPIVNEKHGAHSFTTKVSEVSEAATEGPRFETVDDSEVRQALLIRKKVSGLTFDNVDTAIDAIDSWATLRVFLKKLAKALLAHIKVSDYYRQ